MEKFTKGDKAVAVHDVDEKTGTHGVGFRNLKVVVVNDEGNWFAQGLDIDYAAQGKSLDEVKQHFQDGFKATIEQHLKIFGNIRKLLKPAPAEVWKEFYYDLISAHFEYSHVSIHSGIGGEKLPFDTLEFRHEQPATE